MQTREKRSWTQYRRLVFVLGCIIGILLAWTFRSPDLQLEGLLDSMDMADFFDDLKAALPSALPIGLMREAKEIQEHSRQAVGSGAFSIGEQMHAEGVSAHYPVVMVQLTSFSSMYCSCLTSGPRCYINGIGKLVNYKLLVSSSNFWQ